MAAAIALAVSGSHTDVTPQALPDSCNVKPRWVWGMNPVTPMDGTWCQVISRYPRHHRPAYIVEEFDGHVYVSYDGTFRLPDNIDGSHRLIDVQIYEQLKVEYDNTVRDLMRPYCDGSEPLRVQPYGVAGVQYPVTVQCSDGRTVRVDAPTLPHHNLSKP